MKNTRYFQRTFRAYCNGVRRVSVASWSKSMVSGSCRFQLGVTVKFRTLHTTSLWFVTFLVRDIVRWKREKYGVRVRSIQTRSSNTCILVSRYACSRTKLWFIETERREVFESFYSDRSETFFAFEGTDSPIEGAAFKRENRLRNPRRVWSRATMDDKDGSH